MLYRLFAKFRLCLWPEARFIADDAEQGEIIREARRAVRNTPVWLMSYLALLALWTMGSLTVVYDVVPALEGMVPFFLGQVSGVLLTMGVLVGFRLCLLSGARRRALRKVLHAHGYPICGRCGYNLTGLELDWRCPECGDPVRPQEPDKEQG